MSAFASVDVLDGLAGAPSISFRNDTVKGFYSSGSGEMRFAAAGIDVVRMGTAGLGYATGQGGVVTQATDKSTGVTLNRLCGQVTMNGAALAAAAEVAHTFTNSLVTAVDMVDVAISSGATAGAYTITVDAIAAGSFRVSLGNDSAGSLSEAIVYNFMVFKGANS